MPIYLWSCKECKKEVEIIRSFAEYENPPTQDEAPIRGDTLDTAECTHKWERHVGDKIILTRGANWNGAKGYWTTLLAAGLHYVCSTWI